MSAHGTVYDLGYKPHEGERLGRVGAIRAMLGDGVRRSLGLRRKPWSKALPWGLIGAAMIPAAWYVALTFLVAGLEVEEMGPFASPAEYFEVIGTLAMLFIALITPALLIPDRRHGVLAIYASRPVRATDYLLARFGTLALLASLFILVPQATLYVGVSSLNEGGIWAGLSTNADEIPKVLATTVAYVLGYGAPAVIVSLYVGRVAIAAGVYIVILFVTGGVSDAIPWVGDLVIYKVLAGLSLFFNPLSVRDWIFDEESGDMPLARVGLEPWWGAIAIGVVALAMWLLAVRQYRKEL